MYTEFGIVVKLLLIDIIVQRHFSHPTFCGQNL